MRQELCSQLNNFIAFRNLFSISQIFNYLRRFPLTVNLLITSRCNLKCQICTAKRMLNEAGELTSEQIKSFIRRVHRYKPSIFVGGGEPFAREDIFDILAEIKKFKLKYGVVTNGTLLDCNKIRQLLSVEPDILIFSVYGDKQLHEELTGASGTFELICRNIRYLVEKKINSRIILNCVINEKNYQQLENITLLGKELGVHRVRFEHLVFVTGEEYKKHLAVCRKRFSPKECEMTTHIQDINNVDIGEVLKDTVPRLKKKYGNFVLFKPYLSRNELGGWYRNGFKFSRRCLFISHSVFIKQNGDIIPCQFLSDYKLGNIREDNLAVVWNGQKRKFFNSVLKDGLLPGCMRCCKL